MTFLPTFRDTPSSRQIALIGLPCLKNARRIFAIVSTTSIPTSASKNHGNQCGYSVPGSRLDADHPKKGVLFARRITHSFSCLGCVTAQVAVYAPAPVTREPGSESSTC